MFALRLTAPNRLEYVELDRPKPGPHDLLIRVHRVGICGTDVEMLRGTMPYFKLGWAKYPVILGHEWSGAVVEAGGEVPDFKPGDPVTGDVSVGCGRCVNCMRGDYHVCLVKQEVGLCRGKDGGFAQYLAMPARHCYRLPAGVSLDEGAFVEPAATAVKAIRKIGFAPGATVLVAGDGPIGLLALQAVLAYGAGWVMLSGTCPVKLELGRKLGAHAVVDVRHEDVVAAALKGTDGRGVDYAVEASGHPEAVAQCVNAARQGGTVSLIGIYEQPVTFDLGMAVVRDITLSGSVASPNAFEQTLRLMASGRIKVAPLVTHVFDLAEGAKAFEMQQTKPDERIKIQLKPPTGE